MKLFDKIRDLFDFSLDGDRKYERNFYRFCLSVTLIISVILIFFNNGKNLIHYISSKVEIYRQHRTILKYSKQIKTLDEKIKLLSDNKDSLEYFAREKFLFSAPDEDVYIIEE